METTLMIALLILVFMERVLYAVSMPTIFAMVNHYLLINRMVWVALSVSVMKVFMERNVKQRLMSVAQNLVTMEELVQ